MDIAVDTNVFVRLLSGDEKTVSILQEAVEAAAARGPLTVSPVVYAELAAGRDYAAVDGFFSAKEIGVDWDQGMEVWREAGIRYGRYARDRRRQRGDTGPRRILADFLIGAHALHKADALLTSDTKIFASYFPELRVISPTEQT